MRRRLLQGLEEGIGRVVIHPVGGDDNADLVLALGRLEVDDVQQHARRAVLTPHDLADADLAQLRLRPHPEHVRVVLVLDLLATEALVAAINRRPGLPGGLLAIEGLGQRAGQGLQLAELVAGEEVAVGQAPAFERALQQLHALLLVAKVFECHRAVYKSPARRREEVISTEASLPPNSALGPNWPSAIGHSTIPLAHT